MDFVLAGLLRREADTLAAAKMKQGQGLKALLEHREPDPEIYEQSTEIDEPRGVTSARTFDCFISENISLVCLSCNCLRRVS